MLGHIAEIVAATDLPVNADFESGYAHDPEGVAANVRLCVETGVAGLSIEDATGDPARPLYDLATRSSASGPRGPRSTRPASGVLLTARAECYLVGHPDPLNESLRRLQPMRRRAPTCSTRPARRSREDIRAIVEAVAPKPVNVLVSSADRADGRRPRGPRRAPHQRRLGARPRRLGRLHAGRRGIAREGRFDAFAENRPFAEINTFFRNDLKSRAQETAMTDRLKGKTALVTAAGQGIGRAIAEAFVPRARGSGRPISTSPSSTGSTGPSGASSTCCRTRRSRRSPRETGPVDILVNAAGFVHHGTVLECSDRDWDFSFDLNVKSMHRTIKAYLPGMLERGGGSIVNIASGAGSVRGIPNRYVYGATKAAVIGLTKAVAADFIKRGIRANAICPGTIQSPSLDERIAAQAQASGQSLEAVRQAFVDRQPMGRLGTAEEIAWLAVYLASDEASYTTGQIHLADGGFAL